jgi:hypothetical protein
MPRTFGSTTGDTGRVSNVPEALDRIELGSGRSPAGPPGGGQKPRARASMDHAGAAYVLAVDASRYLPVRAVGCRYVPVQA